VFFYGNEGGMKCKIPGTAREIVDCLILDQDYSVKQIAEMLGITPKTIYRIRKGFCPQPKIHLNLIQLFLSLHYHKNQEEVDEIW
jgi:predicted transcriptional regulator